MLSSTRRSFLATTSLALAHSLLRSRGLNAQVLPASTVHSPFPATAFLPPPMTSLDLRTLANQAIDAATHAGATYADVRVAERHVLDLKTIGTGATPGTLTIAPQFSYGIRVLVDGAWAFVHGTVPSSEQVALSARNAVATARGYGRLHGAHLELAPAPVVTGAWETPIQLDPFTVPLGDQAALMAACMNAAARVRNVSAGAVTVFHWTRETRVFASSAGTVTTQTLRSLAPSMQCSAALLPNDERRMISIPLLVATSGGYESVTMPGLQDDIKRVADEAAWLVTLPTRRLDVGRYPVVFDGRTFGMVLGRTLGVALELDRVLGYEAGAGGTSFLSPPQDMLGTTIASPLLHVTADRTVPSITAVRWDDEGVAAQAVPVITDGRLMSYHTSRQTAAALAMSGQSGHSTGSAVAPSVDQPVLVRTPHLIVTPASTPTTLETLCQDVTHGVLVYYGDHLSVDPQLSWGSMIRHTPLFEIERGKIVRRLLYNGIQFNTRRFWKSLVALGDATTVRPFTKQLPKGQPDVDAWLSVSAPAALFKDIDMINTEVHA